MVIMPWPNKVFRTFINSGLSQDEKKLISKNTLHSFVIQGISVLLVFAANLLLTRLAGVALYGEYVHVFNWVSILSVIALGGRDDLLLARIPKYLIGNERSRIKRLIRKTNLDVFLRSATVIFLFLALIFLIDIKTLSELKYDFLAASVAIYLMSFTSLNQSVLQALHLIKLSQVSEKLLRPFFLIMLLFLLRILAFIIHVRSLIWVANISSMACCLLIIYLISAKINQHAMAHEGKAGGDEEPATKQTFYFFLISLLYLLSTKISMLILPYFMSDKNVGIFNIAYRFADLLIYPFFLMHYVLPQLFAKHFSSSVAYKQSLFSESAILMTVMSIPILVINIFAGKYVLGWFGTEFISGYPSLVYLSLAQFLFSVFGPSNTILMMQGSERYSVIGLFIYLMMLFLTSMLTIPLMGVSGAAISVLVSSLVYNAILAIFTYRLHGVVSPWLTFRLNRSESS
jgi:O-antigen/teichoic acid export membrane protein